MKKSANFVNHSNNHLTTEDFTCSRCNSCGANARETKSEKWEYICKWCGNQYSVEDIYNSGASLRFTFANPNTYTGFVLTSYVKHSLESFAFLWGRYVKGVEMDKERYITLLKDCSQE